MATVANWPLKCGYLVVFGLLLHLLDIGLHLGIAVNYLTMQGCHRSVSHTFQNFKLDDLIGLENLPLNFNQSEDVEKIQLPISDKLSDFLDDSLYLHLRSKIIRILPKHWVDKIVQVVTFQAKKYKGSDIPKMCSLNGKKFETLAEMAIYVCDQAFQETVEVEKSTRAAKALSSIFKGKV